MDYNNNNNNNSSRSSSSNINRHGVKRHTYTRVVTALYLNWPGTEAEWQIAKNPLSTCEYLVR